MRISDWSSDVCSSDLDHRGKRIGLIRAASISALLLFMTIPFVPGVFWVGAVMVAYTLFWHALLPQFEGVALSHLAARGGDYTRVRLWGSIGFIVAVPGLGMQIGREAGRERVCQYV